MRLPPIQRAWRPFDVMLFSNSGAVLPSLKRTGDLGGLWWGVVVALAPLASVAVNRNSRCEGCS